MNINRLLTPRQSGTGTWSTVAFLIVLTLSPIRIGQAQPINGPNVDISGHLDVLAVEGNVAVGNNDFRIGQFALNLSTDVNDRMIAAAEIAYASEDRAVVIDEAYLDWALFRDDGRPRNDPIGFTEVGLLIGQFDVPFGIDWRVYRSVDRLMVSVPMVVARTHRGWNDLGVQFHTATSWGTLAVFAVNGFNSSPALRLEEQAEIAPRLIASADETNSDLVPSEAYGARFGLLMSENAEIGTSFGAGYLADNDQQSRLFGFDATISYEDLQLKGEFISHHYDMTVDRTSDLGFYTQGAYFFDRYFGVLRGETFHREGGPSEYCGSAGAGWLVNRNAQLRAEYRLAEGSSNDTVYLQTAIAF